MRRMGLLGFYVLGLPCGPIDRPPNGVNPMMRTELMPEIAAETPSLEYFPTGKSRPERKLLEEFPFSIGRNENCSLHIDSGRVSREHAVIDRADGVYRVRDVGSTNGTFLNGQLVRESVLRSGDLLVIADLEFTFCHGGAKAIRATATQIIDSGASETTGERGAREIIRGVRRLNETLLQRGVCNQFVPVTELASNLVFGYQALPLLGPGGGARSAAEQLLSVVECRVTSRLRQLHRLLAAEEAARHADQLRFFVGLSPAEVGADSLMESLARLRTLVADDGRLVVEIPDSAACDIPYFREFLHALRNIGVGVAYDNFSGGPTQLAGHRAIAPDYLKLARPLVSGLARNRERQRRLQALVQAALDLGCDVVATGVQSQDEATACRDVGCRLAQGDYFDGLRASGPPPFSPRN